MITLAVISVTSTTPVSGARTTPVKKKRCHAHHGESFWLNVQGGKYEPAD
jgi:hypothetical protein